MASRQDSARERGIADRLQRAEEIVGHVFSDRALLRSALTHPSAVESKDPSSYYERLEFLGDSVLGLFIAEEAFNRFPEMPEGGLTRIKVSLVAGVVLSQVAREFGLADVLILGESEKGTGKRGETSALENTYEALTAALYIDAGPEAAREWVMRTLGPRVSSDAAATPENPKSELQEVLQARGETPVYSIEGQQGPPHDRTFVALVAVGDSVLGRGVGRTKKEAEAHAAARALEAL
jgi:ribonuclease-3